MTEALTKAQELAKLIERVEKATGPDRGLDSAIFAACGMHINPNPSSFEFGRWPDETADGSTFYRIDRITSSIDAALALVERVLGKHWCWQIKSAIQHQCILWMLETDYDDRKPPTGYALTAPLAILIALLRALAESHDAE